MNHRGEVVKAGYLVKSPPEKPGKVAQWHKRWFVLADSRLVYPLADRYVRLEYYQSEGEARKMADPKGEKDCHKWVCIIDYCWQLAVGCTLLT